MNEPKWSPAKAAGELKTSTEYIRQLLSKGKLISESKGGRTLIDPTNPTNLAYIAARMERLEAQECVSHPV